MKRKPHPPNPKDKEANKWIALIDLALEVSKQPQVKETTNALLKELQNALKSNALFMDQIQLSFKRIVRVLEALLSLDF